MDGMGELINQGQQLAEQLAEQHVPSAWIANALPVGLVVVAIGIVVSVLGARMIRPALTVVFGIGGAIAAGRFAYAVDVPWPVTVLVSGLIAGLVGHFLHRLWVGAVASLVVASLALSVFGYYEVLPELQAFQANHPAAVSVDSAATFNLLPPEEQAEYSKESVRDWAGGFWNHLNVKQAGVDRRIALIGAIAGLVGLIIGIVATKGALIFGTALMGTSLLATGATMVMGASAPEVYASALASPRLIGGGIASLFLCSLVVQAMLNRRPAEATSAAKA